ncbi:PREDICTED: probable serine/threonine-protein kinase DDB_G0282963 isoform X2 [Wasmannia auropunctata]|uniref:probable serine/threonine-protein kinase DDB_G0282963 isoform X2 n=1 Tax=Wasmannia auropunctata TaxID=64793 RepID=UPI0005F08F07|nr:PREDICTED: probable serine/threonine-protein kinase DDB_G0282963 isoform X2 [Wasmannia auropunctata]
MDLFSRQLQNDIQWEFRKEIEKFKDEMSFKERDWKKERNELKERIKKLETNWEHYNNNRQNNMRQLEQENNTRDTSSLTFTSGRSQLQSIRPTTYSRTESTRGNDNLTAGPSGTSRNVQSHNSNVSEPSGSNRPNVANTVSNIKENDAFRVTSDDVNRSTNKSNQSAPGNSRNVNNTDDDSAKIICKCRKPAIRFVQKEGLYKDRPYYKCAYSKYKPHGSRCDFFWDATDNVESQDATNEYSSSVSNMDKNNAGVGTSNINSLTAQADPNKEQSFGVRRTVNSNNSYNRNVYSRANQSNSNSFKRCKYT